MGTTRANLGSEASSGGGIQVNAVLNAGRYVSGVGSYPSASAIAASDDLLPHNLFQGAVSMFRCDKLLTDVNINWPDTALQSIPIWNGGPSIIRRANWSALAESAGATFPHEGTWGIFPYPPFAGLKNAADRVQEKNVVWDTYDGANGSSGFEVLCFPHHHATNMLNNLLNVPTGLYTADGITYADRAIKANLFYTVQNGVFYTRAPISLAGQTGRYLIPNDGTPANSSPVIGRQGAEVSWWDGDSEKNPSAVTKGTSTTLTINAHGWGSGTTAPNADFSVWITGMVPNPTGAVTAGIGIRLNGRWRARRVDANTIKILNDDGSEVNSAALVSIDHTNVRVYRAYEETGFSFTALCFGNRRGAYRFKPNGDESAELGYANINSEDLADVILGAGGERFRA